ncbi:MAG TPA: BrnT family toxin [Acidobacteriaceae bacterium]|nr:BrnT family toxin [Acidobacteriaceae bacterium]
MTNYEWDEAKRHANILKHGLDFHDAKIVYENPRKKTFSVVKKNEPRLQDIALVEYHGVILSLVYVIRNDVIRVISFRRASRAERRKYGV